MWNYGLFISGINTVDVFSTLYGHINAPMAFKELICQVGAVFQKAEWQTSHRTLELYTHEQLQAVHYYAIRADVCAHIML